ncbi:hypothetical protein EDD18DRAFT_1100425 [Armillaria luteobubalina]|uniref:Uncharacterized protein n=1 Tax=Armillaria luteobubalina TaxID=153913 RepID=A0AA39QHG1_9AGAR|nr:hypothetical protein EDD18DRAFT_1100425 [Armillaria luteobubalina]
MSTFQNSACIQKAFSQFSVFIAVDLSGFWILDQEIKHVSQAGEKYTSLKSFFNLDRCTKTLRLPHLHETKNEESNIKCHQKTHLDGEALIDVCMLQLTNCRKHVMSKQFSMISRSSWRKQKQNQGGASVLSAAGFMGATRVHKTARGHLHRLWNDQTVQWKAHFYYEWQTGQVLPQSMLSWTQ